MILYLGNILSSHGKTASVIEFLSVKLAEFTKVHVCSNKRSQFLRLCHMMWAIITMRTKVSLVIIDAFSSKAFWYAFFSAALCRIFRIPFIPVLHGGDFPNRLRRSPRACNFVFAHSAVNISPSYYLEEHFKRAKFRVQYIPNFLEIGKYEFKDRPYFRPTLLWVRSFHELYNPLLAIDILASIKKRYPSAALCMVGPDKDGSMLRTKQRAIDLGLAESVIFTGLLSKAEWISLSRECDIFINTTNFDNMPVSVIEAMALGLPIVSTNVGGLPYLIRNEIDGLLVNPSSVMEFSSAVERILLDSDLGRTLAVSARRKALTFDWSITGPQWRNVINKYQLKGDYEA
jgi:L-malate glycosyltransferase